MKKLILLIVGAGFFSFAAAQTSVSSIASLKALNSGTEAALTLSSAKVLYVYTNGTGTQAFVRDDSGAIELVNPGATLTANDDVSGTVSGTFTLEDNVPQFVVASGALTATPGTAAEPVVLTDFAQVAAHQCDLVQLVKGTYDNSGGGSVYDSEFNSVFFKDAFNTGYEAPGNGLLYVTGITVTEKNDEGGDQYYIYPTDKKTFIAYYFSQDITNKVPGWAEGATVYMDRSPLYASHWNTFCVPFDMTGDQVKQYFGEGTIVTEFTGVEGTTMMFEPSDDGSINSGIPYLIRPGHDVTKFIFEGVDVYGSADNVQLDGYYFYGTFDPYDFADGDVIDMSALFLGKDDKLYYATTDDHVMPGMRAFFWLPDDVTAASAKYSVLGVTDGIERVVTDGVKGGKAPVYNANGQYMGTSLSGLPHGVYIQNGKKYIK